MSVLNKMTYAQVQSALSGVTYESAINYYQNLKNSFLNQYAMAMDKSVLEVEKIFKDEIVDEINSEGIEESGRLANILFEEVHDAVISALEGTSKFPALANKAKSTSEFKKKLGQQEVQLALNEILDENKMRDLILQSLSKYGKSIGSFDISDLLNQVRSYRNRMLLIRTNTSAKRYKISSKGYFREALVHKAFSKLNDHLGHTVVISTGSKKTESNLDTVYDEFIDFFNSIEGTFNTVVNEKIDDITNTGFGIQSKSWKAPWERNDSNNPFVRYSMSGQAELFNYLKSLNMGFNTFSWIKGVQFLEQHITSAIGPRQVIFSTGGGFYWTGELIANFRQMGYYYAFVFDKNHQATKSTSWQQINMDA